jgi:membrane protein YdbS with pleckstrin-like domain
MEKDIDINRMKITVYLFGVGALVCLLILAFLWFFYMISDLWVFLLLLWVGLLATLGYACCTPMIAWAYRYRLGDKMLRIDKGVFFKSRKSIPLDKITDLELVQGPFLRMLGMWLIKVQTASTALQTPAATLLGVINPEKVREEIMAARTEYLKSR